MKAEYKNGVEYGLITLLIGGLCLWQLISGSQDDSASPALMTMAGLGLLVAGTMHCVFMMQLVKRSGRSFWPWAIGVVILFPIGTAVLLATLLGEQDATEN